MIIRDQSIYKYFSTAPISYEKNKFTKLQGQ